MLFIRRFLSLIISVFVFFKYWLIVYDAKVYFCCSFAFDSLSAS